jgi:hypothetical protein
MHAGAYDIQTLVKPARRQTARTKKTEEMVVTYRLERRRTADLLNSPSVPEAEVSSLDGSENVGDSLTPCVNLSNRAIKLPRW